jgi:hypothetical protein
VNSTWTTPSAFRSDAIRRNWITSNEKKQKFIPPDQSGAFIGVTPTLKPDAYQSTDSHNPRSFVSPPLMSMVVNYDNNNNGQQFAHNNTPAILPYYEGDLSEQMKSLRSEIQSLRKEINEKSNFQNKSTSYSSEKHMISSSSAIVKFV